MALQVPLTAGFIAVDTTSTKTLQLPLSTEIVGRVITIKDRTGNASSNPIVIQTQGLDIFQDGATIYRITQPYGSATFVCRSGQWLLQQGTELINASTIVTNSLFVSSISVSSFIGGGFVTPSNLTSSIVGLGSSGYISSSQLISSVGGLERYISSFIDPQELASSVLQFISSTYLTTQLMSTVSGLGSSGYVSSLSLVSTTAGITVNYSTFLSTTLATYNFPYSGETLYLNNSVPNAPYQTLSITNIIGASSSNVTTVPGTSINNFIIGFQSDFYLPTFITTGLWTVKLFSQASATGVSVYAALFTRNPTTTVETLIATSSNSPFLVPLTKVSLDLTFDVPYTNITLGDTLVIKIFANNTSGASRTLTTFYENGNYSHVATTLGTGSIATTTFTSSIIGLGTFGYVSTLSLYSTVEGLGSAGYISSTSLASSLISTTNFVSQSFSSFSTALSPTITSNLVSTVQGLGSSGYVSTLSLISTTNFISQSFSSFSTAFGPGGGINTTNLTSTVQGLGSAGYVSTFSLQSTVTGLGSSEYVSTQSLFSTSASLQTNIENWSFYTSKSDITLSNGASLKTEDRNNALFLRGDNIQFIGTDGGWGILTAGDTMSFVTSSVSQGYSIGFNEQVTGTVSSFFIVRFTGNDFSVAPLYLSSLYLGNLGASTFGQLTTDATASDVYWNGVSLTAGGGGGGITTQNLISTVVGLGTANYVSTATLAEALLSTTGGIYVNINQLIDGLGSFGYISTSGLTSTVEGLGSSGYLSSGGQGYFSTVYINMLPQDAPAWNSNVPAAGIDPEPNPLALDVFGSARILKNIYIGSTTTIIGTGAILTPATNTTSISTATAIISSIGFVSPTSEVPLYLEMSSGTLVFNGTPIGGGGDLNTGNLTSTVAGLGSAAYVSSLSLQSTVRGLGSIGYLSTFGPILSTSLFLTSSVLASTITTSSLQVQSLIIGTGTGWVNLGPLQTVAISSIQDNTNALYANTSFFGTTSTATALQFYGLFGNYNNTILAEVSTGAGTQEFLVFKGSSSSDRIRMQTTGNFVIETGVSARLWDSNTIPTQSNATPAFIVNSSSNVGIQTASPGATLDVAGTGRFQIVSTLTLNVSSINGQPPGSGGGGGLSNANLTSTVEGLGTAGYVSTLSLISTTNFISQSFSSFSTAFGPPGGGSLITANLTSTVEGLGSSGYVSTLSLISTTDFISQSFSSFSTAFGPGGGGGGITTANLTSTVGGLGQLYLSSIPSILSTSQFFTSSAVISTATIGIMSSLITNASTANMTIVTTSTVTTNAMTIGSGSGWIFTSPIQTAAVSTNTIWADTSYITTENVTTGNISSVVTNTLTVGIGGGWLLTSPIQTSIVSSVYAFANQPFFDTVNIGSVSTMNSLEYYGLFGNYNNTVMAEISTGGGAQELLIFKGSSTSDRVRVQTTGNFVIETGVSARLFNSNTLQTLSNATPAFVINTSSNVGIQTASPGATLDVAGTGRFVTLSTVALFASSIVAPYVFQPQYFTF